MAKYVYTPLAVVMFVGTLGAAYLIRRGVARIGGEAKNDRADERGMTGRAQIVAAIGLWLFLVFSVVYALLSLRSL